MVHTWLARDMATSVVLLVIVFSTLSECCLKERLPLRRQRNRNFTLSEMRKLFFRFQAADQLVAGRTFTTAQGFVKAKYKQIYKGVEVYDASIVLERNTREGNEADVFTGWAYGQIVRGVGKDLRGNVTPSITPQEAIIKCKLAFCQTAPQTVFFPSTRFYIYTGKPSQETFCRITYQVRYLSISKGTQDTCIIDAVHGTVLDKFSTLKFFPKPRSSDPGTGSKPSRPTVMPSSGGPRPPLSPFNMRL